MNEKDQFLANDLYTTCAHSLEILLNWLGAPTKSRRSLLAKVITETKSPILNPKLIVDIIRLPMQYCLGGVCEKFFGFRICQTCYYSTAPISGLLR